jgi:hypothetical protein
MIKDVNISNNIPIKVTIGGTVFQSNIQVPDEYLTQSEGDALYQPINTPVLTWTDYATGFSEEPVLTATIAEGDVYTYTYQNSTLYRLVPSGLSVDSFYTTFDGTTLSGLVVSKTVNI